MLPVKFRQSSRPSRASPQGLCDLAAGPKAPGPLAAVWVEHKMRGGPSPLQRALLGNTSRQPGPFIKARKGTFSPFTMFTLTLMKGQCGFRGQGSGVRRDSEHQTQSSSSLEGKGQQVPGCLPATCNLPAKNSHILPISY